MINVFIDKNKVIVVFYVSDYENRERVPACSCGCWYKDVGGAGMRVKVTLACTECKQRNYDTMKNKKNNPDRLEVDKYCKFCKKHTPHKETK